VNLFSDHEIIELPGGARLQPALARIIARLRAPSVRRRNYAFIGGRSPQLPITHPQASALGERLNAAAAGQRFQVFVAMRYSRPTCEDALEAIAAAGIRRIVTLTLFPHYSKATTSIRELERTLVKPRWRGLDVDVTHIGHEAADVLVGSMVSGIFAGDASRLSLRCCFPKMHEMAEYCSLVRAVLAKRREARSENADAASLGPIVRTSRRVIGLQPGPGAGRHAFSVACDGPRVVEADVVGHGTRVAGIERALAQPGLFLAGNSYRGVSVSACIEDAGRVAKDVAARLAVIDHQGN